MWDTSQMLLPTRDEAMSQLERVLASEIFAGTNRLSRFLRFAAERSLAGESERLKEYVIGVEVFDRSEHYDPRVDSIVRVEAGRLRTKLEQYYHGPGQNDAILIRLHKGSYAPVFEWRLGRIETTQTASPPAGVLTELPAAQPASSASVGEARPSAQDVPPPTRKRWLPVAGAILLLAIAAIVAVSMLSPSTPPPANAVAVLPFEPHSGAREDAMIATQVTEGITAALVRHGEFAVVPSRNARQIGADGTAQSAARRLGASWLLEGRLERDDASLRVHARIVNPERNRKAWAETFAGSSADLDELCRRIAASAAARLQKTADDQNF